MILSFGEEGEKLTYIYIMLLDQIYTYQHVDNE